jgi:phosphoribosyl 1,2-cyclic phosphate phosphodiesterase
MGYRINDVVYLTDVNGISDESMDHLIGAKVLIVSALRKDPHVAHYALSEAIAMAKKSKIPQVYFTHFSHLMGLHAIESKSLPKGMAFAHDGLKISLT